MSPTAHVLAIRALEELKTAEPVAQTATEAEEEGGIPLQLVVRPGVILTQRGLQLRPMIARHFKDFLSLLNAHRVEYLLVGGYVVGYYGYPRATADMDIWVAISPKNADRLVAVLKAFGFDVPELSVDLFLEENQIIRMRF